MIVSFGAPQLHDDIEYWGAFTIPFLNSFSGQMSSTSAILIVLFHVLQKEEEFVFSDISKRPVPSLLRGYSAPVRLDSDLTDSDLFFLLAYDSDEFNRYNIKP